MSELKELFLQNELLKLKRLPKPLEFRPVTIDDNAYFSHKFSKEQLDSLRDLGNIHHNLPVLMTLICHLLTNESKIYLATYEDKELFLELDDYGKPLDRMLSLSDKVMKLAYEFEFLALLDLFLGLKKKSNNPNQVSEEKDEKKETEWSEEEKKRIQRPMKKQHGRK